MKGLNKSETAEVVKSYIFSLIWGSHLKHLCWVISITFVWFVHCNQLKV